MQAHSELRLQACSDLMPETMADTQKSAKFQNNEPPRLNFLPSIRSLQCAQSSRVSRRASRHIYGLHIAVCKCTQNAGERNSGSDDRVWGCYWVEDEWKNQLMNEAQIRDRSARIFNACDMKWLGSAQCRKFAWPIYYRNRVSPSLHLNRRDWFNCAACPHYSPSLRVFWLDVILIFISRFLLL